MSFRVVLPLLLTFASPAFAEQPPPADGGTPSQDEPGLAGAIDAAAGQQPPDAGTPSQDDSDLGAAIDAAAGKQPPSSSASAANPSARAFQSLNPDMSVIVDSDVGIARAPPYSLAGDDPDITGKRGLPAGFTVQELEAAFQAVVDPFFRADVFLTIPNLQGLEVEEAVVTTTSLPASLQVRAGIFRSAFGRQNGQHLHVQDFTRRPLVNEAYLGADGLRSPGLQVSWLVPVPFYLALTGEAFSVSPPDTGVQHLTTFGGGLRTDVTTAAELKAFFPAGESLSIYAGLNAAHGVSPGGLGATGTLERAGAQTLLEAADLYVKYKPPNETGGYFSLAWTTEYFVRQVGAAGPGEATLTDGGMYTQLVAQLGRQWFLGLRQDFLGLPASPLQPAVARTSASLTWAASEFARARGYVERETSGAANWAAFLQLEIAIGAHGAHPF